MTKLSDENKVTIRNIISDYYGKYAAIEKLTLKKTITSSELYNMMSDVIYRYNENRTKTHNEIDREFNLQQDEILNDSSIKKYYALAYFYIFADILSKITICYEIITKIPVTNVMRRFASLWDINKLDLEKKYNYTYFLERYNSLDKDILLNEYLRKFYVSHQSKEKITVASTKVISKMLPKLISKDELNTIKSYNTLIIANAYNSITAFNNAVAQLYSKISSFAIKNIYYNNEEKNDYSIKETRLQDYESLGLSTAMCSIGLHISNIENHGVLYQNNKIIMQDKLDVDYEVNKEYINNFAELFKSKNAISWKSDIINPDIINPDIINPDIINPDRIRYASFINNTSTKFSIGNIFKFHKLPVTNIISSNLTNKKFSYGISKSLSSEIITGLYLNKNINIMIDFLNTIKIILSADGRKHVRTMGFGDFILNIPLIKQRKIELSNSFVEDEDKYNCIPALQSQSQTKTIAYNLNVDVNNIANVIGLKISSISKDTGSDDVILTQNNYSNNMNSSYIAWYNLFKYVTASNNHVEPAEELNNYSKVKKLKDRFNKLNNKTQIIYKNIMDNVSIKNLRTMYSKYKISKITSDDTNADNFASFTNIIYRNNLVRSLYQYVIDYTGISYADFIDVNNIYSENKADIDTVKECYSALFEYMYRSNKINNALNETFNLYNNEMEMKQIKKMFLYKSQLNEPVVNISIKNKIYTYGDENGDENGDDDVNDNDLLYDANTGNMIEEINYEEEQLDGDGNMEEDDYNFEEEGELVITAEADLISEIESEDIANKFGIIDDIETVVNETVINEIAGNETVVNETVVNENADNDVNVTDDN